MGNNPYLLLGEETERLTFRKLENSDFDVWMELFQDDMTAKLLGMDEYQTPKERCDKWFEWTFHRYENNLGGQNILISKEKNEIIGQSGLLVREIDNHTELEIAYSILPDHRRKGYAFEAAEKCRDYAFEKNFIDRLVSIIVPENENSKKVAIKNGMKLNKQINFQYKTMDLFQITKTEWNYYKLNNADR